MKIIDVLNIMAKDKIEKDTKLIVSNDFDDYEYKYSKRYDAFFNKDSNVLEDIFYLGKDFLNLEAELIPPKEKKYLVKFNMRGLRNGMNYLNYDKDNEHVSIFDKSEWSPVQTKFTEKEMQSIKVVREFLEDMEGKYELIEAEENEGDNQHGN